MTKALMQKVLGEDWYLLPDSIRRHYDISDGGKSRLHGEMEITYPGYLFPWVWTIHLFGGLVLWPGKAVAAEVDKRADGGVLQWRRTLSYADGKSDCFYSSMRFAADNELIEDIGFGFGLRMRVEVDEGELLYRSLEHFWQWRNFKLKIPDWLLLGSAEIREHALGDGFRLDFKLTHPLWGITYRYAGGFLYSPAQ
ncbi:MULTISPECIES: DUF4166 domain-containing protein [Methylomonas]|uniref:DUF4166 domain-containing protein n=1 Tax=Methylomonas TaxID=416 RepID=UPI00167FECD7|nr:DUF4166 domain-containing protein [Methylomonas rhizoryzae]